MTYPYLHFEEGRYDPERSHGLQGSGITLSHDEVASLVVPSGAQAVIVDHFPGQKGSEAGLRFSRELELHEEAHLDYYLLQEGSGAAKRAMVLTVRQASDSSFRGHVLTLAGGSIDNELKILLAGEGAKCRLNGLYFAMGEERVMNRLQVDHLKPHGSSRLFFKGILGGRARAAFHGRVVVHEGAVKTDADQTNKNLLLSREAEADPRPELEIYNNDVKCSHGATVGQLDHEALFYLRSRGIACALARQILTQAFASEILNRFPADTLRAYGQAELQKCLATVREGEN